MKWIRANELRDHHVLVFRNAPAGVTIRYAELLPSGRCVAVNVQDVDGTHNLFFRPDELVAVKGE